jgi:hypothetical protein
MKYLIVAIATGCIATLKHDVHAQGSGTGTVYPTPTCEKGFKYDPSSQRCVPIRKKPRGSH